MQRNKKIDCSSCKRTKFLSGYLKDVGSKRPMLWVSEDVTTIEAAEKNAECLYCANEQNRKSGEMLPLWDVLNRLGAKLGPPPWNPTATKQAIRRIPGPSLPPQVRKKRRPKKRRSGSTSSLGSRNSKKSQLKVSLGERVGPIKLPGPEVKKVGQVQLLFPDYEVVEINGYYDIVFHNHATYRAFPDINPDKTTRSDESPSVGDQQHQPNGFPNLKGKENYFWELLICALREEGEDGEYFNFFVSIAWMLSPRTRKCDIFKRINSINRQKDKANALAVVSSAMDNTSLATSLANNMATEKARQEAR